MSLVFLSCATNTQLSAYLMLKYELFAEKHEGSPKVYTAVRNLGLQNSESEDESKVWVLNNKFQFDKSGKAIELNESRYVWLGDLIKAPKCLGIVNNNLSAKFRSLYLKRRCLETL